MSLTSNRNKKRTAWFLGLLMVPVLGLYSFAAVQAESTAAISQGFKTEEVDIAAGALVSLTSDSQSTVQLSNTDRVNQLIGVIGDRPLIELSNNDKEVQVVISGTTLTLVSDINGEIKSGDKITASPINGVGMKANASSLVVGTAQDDLGSTNTTTKSINDKRGQPQSVKVGAVPVSVNVTYYVAPEDKNSFLPPFLQSLANTVAGKEVSAVRVLISSLVLIFGFVSIAVLLYSSIRSSIISIGRNPLSESAVRKSLFEVGATALGILLVMLIAIYLVLTT
ncbi:MAG TPA: hypothetical protein VJM46_05165 [Candidatus Saccharimonadales bacterium]|nr:hypothetical protein [Candidatus Saccharimonadales bacterium]